MQDHDIIATTFPMGFKKGLLQLHVDSQSAPSDYSAKLPILEFLPNWGEDDVVISILRVIPLSPVLRHHASSAETRTIPYWFIAFVK